MCRTRVRVTGVKFYGVRGRRRYVMKAFYVPGLLSMLKDECQVCVFMGRGGIIVMSSRAFSRQLVDEVGEGQVRRNRAGREFLCGCVTRFVDESLRVLITCRHELLQVRRSISRSRASAVRGQLVPVQERLLGLEDCCSRVVSLAGRLRRGRGKLFLGSRLGCFKALASHTSHLVDHASRLLRCTHRMGRTCRSRVSGERGGGVRFLAIVSAVFFPLALVAK